MTGREVPGGGMTAGGGTPYPVDVSSDRRARRDLLVFLGGPLLWFAHFMVVYLVAEAGCTGAGYGLEVFDPPVPDIVTVVATVVGALAAAAAAVVARRRWRSAAATAETPGEDGPASLAFAGYLLSLFAVVAILFVGVAAPFLRVC